MREWVRGKVEQSSSLQSPESHSAAKRINKQMEQPLLWVGSRIQQIMHDFAARMPCHALYSAGRLFHAAKLIRFVYGTVVHVLAVSLGMCLRIQEFVRLEDAQLKHYIACAEALMTI